MPATSAGPVFWRLRDWFLGASDGAHGQKRHPRRWLLLLSKIEGTPRFAGAFGTPAAFRALFAGNHIQHLAQACVLAHRRYLHQHRSDGLTCPKMLLIGH